MLQVEEFFNLVSKPVADETNKDDPDLVPFSIGSNRLALKSGKGS